MPDCIYCDNLTNAQTETNMGYGVFRVADVAGDTGTAYEFRLPTSISLPLIPSHDPQHTSRASLSVALSQSVT
jgi:hypothetical protein